MSPSSNTTNTPAMRQSCDRCHRQKLRCTRGGTSNTGACDRCLRRRTQCVYSSSLPKGRPSIYHSPNNGNASSSSSNNANNNTTTTSANNETSAGTQPAVASPPPAAPVTPTSLSGSSVLNHPGPPDDIPPSSPDVPGSVAVGSGPSARTPVAEISNPYGNTMHEIKADPGTAVTSAVSCDSIMGTCIEDFSSENWRWPAPSLAGDDSMFMDWSSHDPSVSTFSWEETLDPATTATFAPPVVTPLNTFTNDRHIEPGPESLFRPHHHYHGSIGGNGATSAYAPSYTWPIAADNSDPDAVIAQLSELSMRLASLRRSGQALSQPSLAPGSAISTESPEKQSYRGPAWHSGELFDDAAFESVASWLVGGGAHGSAGTYAPPVRPMRSASEPAARGRGGEILHDIFSTSHRLLEILHGLQLPVVSSAPPTAVRASTPPSPPPLSPSSPSSSSSSSLGSRNRSGTGIIRHLIIACYTSLLSTYSAVLMALARDVLGHDHPSQSSDMRSPVGEGMRPGSGMPLGQIRLVSVVQLCSYLVRRQHQAVDAYLATSAKESGNKGLPSPSIALGSSTAPPSPPDLAGSGEAGAEEKWKSSCSKSGHYSHSSLRTLAPSICTCSDVDELKREMAEVQQRLAQLQSALHI